MDYIKPFLYIIIMIRYMYKFLPKNRYILLILNQVVIIHNFLFKYFTNCICDKYLCFLLDILFYLTSILNKNGSI